MADIKTRQRNKGTIRTIDWCFLHNKKYSHAPGSIKDPEYSIQCGVQYLADCLNKAGCKSPVDMSHIRLALQGYNYGNGYILWAIRSITPDDKDQFMGLRKTVTGANG